LDCIAAVAEEYFSAGALYGAGQGYIFKEASGDGGVSADEVVGFARD
jgi:hypothetical protein